MKYNFIKLSTPYYKKYTNQSIVLLDFYDCPWASFFHITILSDFQLRFFNHLKFFLPH
jgi:hypothetical protein